VVKGDSYGKLSEKSLVFFSLLYSGHRSHQEATLVS
jgi:hypothetical protein